MSPSDTQPTPTSREGLPAAAPPSGLPPANTPPMTPTPKRRRWLPLVLAGAAGLLALTCMVAAGVLGGYRAAQQEQRIAMATNAVVDIAEQYQLGIENFQNGNLDLARQRFQFVLEKDPAFPGAAEQLANVLAIMYATATPSPLPPTATATPTPDLRPVEQLLTSAQQKFADGDWQGVIDTLIGLRQADQAYQVAKVDGLLYLALRNRGMNKINQDGNLGGGMYDLTQAERFALLDGEAENLRTLARIYLIGSSFWQAYPQEAVFYFAQVAAAAPYMRDASGWTAFERYRQALLIYGDWLAAKGEWCAAQEQYLLAQAQRAFPEVEPTLTFAYEQCFTPTPELSATETPTVTPTFTVTPPFFPTFTPTPPLVDTPTPTQPVTLPSETPTQPAPLPSDTPTEPPPAPAPSETPTPPDSSGG